MELKAWRVKGDFFAPVGMPGVAWLLVCVDHGPGHAPGFAASGSERVAEALWKRAHFINLGRAVFYSDALVREVRFPGKEGDRWASEHWDRGKYQRRHFYDFRSIGVVEPSAWYQEQLAALRDRRVVRQQNEIRRRNNSPVRPLEPAPVLGRLESEEVARWPIAEMIAHAEDVFLMTNKGMEHGLSAMFCLADDSAAVGDWMDRWQPRFGRPVENVADENELPCW